MSDLPITVLQFGEGNFLRAFADYMIDVCNEKKLFNVSVVIVKPIRYGTLNKFRKQACRYHVLLRGMAEGRAFEQIREINCVSDVLCAYEDYHSYSEYARSETLRFIISNTTEAGIVLDPDDRYDFVPPNSFPGKLTKFLHQRWKHFQGAPDKGVIMLPVELIDDNGSALRSCVHQLCRLWALEPEFVAWLDHSCVFANTLVDRIVSGFPADEAEAIWKRIGMRDELLVACEPFALWVIESEKDISEEFPLPQAGLPVLFTKNQKPYKQRKVRILNGAHTSFCLMSYLCGNDLVLQSMEDAQVSRFIHDIIRQEIIPTLDLPKEDLICFADSVEERFRNPYVKHQLLSISLNSVSKWKARCMPSLLEYVMRFGVLPMRLTFSLAALMAFYHGKEMIGDTMYGERGQQKYPVHDDPEVLSFFMRSKEMGALELTDAYLSDPKLSDPRLARLPGIAQTVGEMLDSIYKQGMRNSLNRYFPSAIE